ncbi:unnamed protein product [Acanthoscelides obtectus]|uniref:Uncharacterized protein n=1 Tax=Acanthoscelides obtectus TaxID=200917 RepID=A0A9P0M3D9_ACAOB|nr:unnamed protein product [Acanthoscelides obtectus]CAK1683785.1 hypothetical protein AOBTE_LOCUS34454 [Acanthoscelides obtectus]
MILEKDQSNKRDHLSLGHIREKNSLKKGRCSQRDQDQSNWKDHQRFGIPGRPIQIGGLSKPWAYPGGKYIGGLTQPERLSKLWIFPGGKYFGERPNQSKEPLGLWVYPGGKGYEERPDEPENPSKKGVPEDEALGILIERILNGEISSDSRSRIMRALGCYLAMPLSGGLISGVTSSEATSKPSTLSEKLKDYYKLNAAKSKSKEHRDVYIELKRCVYGLQLPVGFKRAFLHNIYKYFELLPQLKLGGPRSEEELYCQTKIIVTLIEACKGVPLEPKSIRILLDATVLLIRLVSGPLEELPPPVQESQTEVNITIDVEVQQNVELAPPLDNEYKFLEITQESYEYGPGPEEYVAPEEPQVYEQPQFEISMEANMTFEELSYEEQFPEPVVEPSPVPVPERFQEKHELRLEFEQKYESESGLLPRQDYPGDRPGYTNISFELEVDESYPPENTHLPLVVEEEEIEANISITYENNLVPYIEQPVYQTVNEDLTVNITIERESVELVEPSTELAVPEMPDVVESYYSEISIDWDLYYGNNPDDNTPSYIPTPEPVLNAVSPLKETLETLVGGNQPLTLLPEVVETAKIVNRIKIDIKISIERIVGTLIGYRPGLCEVVRQVYSLTASLLHTTVPQNNPRTIDILVKVILSSLRNAQPSILRVIEGVLSKLFSKILMPSTFPLDEILKQVIPLISNWSRYGTSCPTDQD